MAETCEQKLERSEYRRRCQRIQLRRFQQLHAVSKHNALFTTMAVRKYEAERYRADALAAENAELRKRAVKDGWRIMAINGPGEIVEYDIESDGTGEYDMYWWPNAKPREYIGRFRTWADAIAAAEARKEKPDAKDD